jgi:uncharacterized membrane protein (UPF0136 family)
MGIKFVRFFIKNYLFSLICAIFLVAYWISASKLDPRALRYPMIISVVAVFMLLWNWVNCVLEFRKTYNPADDEKVEKKKYDITLGLNRKKITVILSTIGYAVMAPVLGFFVTTFLYLSGVTFYLGERKPVRVIIFAVIYTAILYMIFRVWLQLRTPTGIFNLI